MIGRVARLMLAAARIFSLLVFLVIVAAWVRSYWRTDVFGWEGPVRPGHVQRGGNASSGGGLFACEVWARLDPKAAAAPASALEHSTYPPTPGSADARRADAQTRGGFHAFGFGFERRATSPRPADRVRNPGARAPGPAPTQVVWNVAVPYWQPAAAFAAAPAWWVVRTGRRRRQGRRADAGLCPDCGYDVRGTPEKGGPLLGRCPECGALSGVDRAAGEPPNGPRSAGRDDHS